MSHCSSMLNNTIIHNPKINTKFNDVNIIRVAICALTANSLCLQQHSMFIQMTNSFAATLYIFNDTNIVWPPTSFKLLTADQPFCSLDVNTWIPTYHGIKWAINLSKNSQLGANVFETIKTKENLLKLISTLLKPTKPLQK